MVRRSLKRLGCSAMIAGLFYGAGLHTELSAQGVHDFYKGKQVTFIVAFNPGGTYDTYARLASVYLSKHLEGHPSIIVRNMQGANGGRGANFLAEQAANDGSVIGMVSQAIALKKVLEDPSVRLDVSQLNWIGRMSSAIEATVVWHTSPTKTIQDATTRETVLAATGALGTPETNPRLMNRYAGTKFKIIAGYPGTAATMLAMEKGEVEGAYAGLGTLLSSHGDWLKDKKINVLVQYSTVRHSAFPDVPAIVEFARTAEERTILELYASSAEIGLSIVAPPRIPETRLAALRSAFNKVVGDTTFLADARSRRMEIEPLSGEALQARVLELLKISPDVVKKAAAARE